MWELFCNKVLVEWEFLSPTPRNDHSTCFQNFRCHNQLFRCCVHLAPGNCRALHCRSSNGLFVIKRFCVLSDSQSAEWRYDIRRRYVIHHRLTTGGSPQDGLILRTDRRAGSYQRTWGRLLPRFVKVYVCGIFHYEAGEEVKKHLCFDGNVSHAKTFSNSCSENFSGVVTS